MGSHPFHIVDVFAEKKYAGNQLAVIMQADDIDTATMQAIALEMNYPETTFVLADRADDGAWPVRIFTPVAEVPFAGHPTLGTAWIIRKELADPASRRIELALKVGRIPVTFDRSEPGDEVLWMKQMAADFGDTASAETMAAILRLGIDDIDDRYPCQDVSTGLPFWIVPLKTIDAVRRARIDLDRLEALTATARAKMIFFFAPQAAEAGNDIHSRMFGHHFGVPEDPATGSANGCFAAWLTHHRYYNTDAIDVRVEQGYSIHRPSLLRLRTSTTNHQITIQVGGRVIHTATATLL